VQLVGDWNADMFQVCDRSEYIVILHVAPGIIVKANHEDSVMLPLRCSHQVVQVHEGSVITGQLSAAGGLFLDIPVV
jgi:hypothetical protein